MKEKETVRTEKETSVDLISIIVPCYNEEKSLPAFYRAIKEQGVGMREITHVLATHYHPAHIGLISANIPPLQRDWARVMHDHPRIIYYAHADEKALR